MRRRSTLATFTLSFLDCICCGLGAVLLLFVLTAGVKSESSKVNLAEVRERIGAMEQDIEASSEALRRMAQLLADNAELRTRLEAEIARDTQDRDTLTQSLQLAERRQGDLRDSVARLLDELAALPTTDLPVAAPRPNPIRRQYLTDFKLDGSHVLFLLEASGSMLDETVETALTRVGHTAPERRDAPKWRRAVAATEWLLGSLRPPSRYRVVLFGGDVKPLLPEATGWLRVDDRERFADLVDALRDHAPAGPANLERALNWALTLDPPPDNIVLLVDGYPTASETMPEGGYLDEPTRAAMFDLAIRRLPPRVPLNIMLFPWSEDPTAPANFWILANRTRGSFISPARSWPDTTRQGNLTTKAQSSEIERIAKSFSRAGGAAATQSWVPPSRELFKPFEPLWLNRFPATD